jgi:hypothetical protein
MVAEAEEANNVVMRSRLPDPALPKLMKSTWVCLVWLTSTPTASPPTHANRNCKFVNDLKADPEASYKRARKNMPRGKGGKAKEEAKELSDMEEDEAPPEPKGDCAAESKNPYDKKSATTYHTFLGEPTSKAKKSAPLALNGTLPKSPNT